jgi:uncharacterized protein
VTAARQGRLALRALGVFWAAVVVLLAAGLGTLQWLGPPPIGPVVEAPRMDGAKAEVPAAPAPPGAPPVAPVPTAPTATAPPAAPSSGTASLPPVQGPAGAPPVTGRIAPTPRAPGAPVPPADPALLEASGLGDGTVLPRIAGGLAPMRAYAAGAPPLDARPRVAILLADFAMREADSEEALKLLPPAISLVISPYAPRQVLARGGAQPDGLMARAREKGHELFVSLPMEPRGYPLDDPGERAMLTGATAERNALALRWALSRVTGYVGATGALGALRGERFAASEQMGLVLEELGRRGLLYVDPRPEGRLAGPATPGAIAGPRRAVDVVVDEPAVRTEIDAKLARLEQLARDRGTALGLASAPTPVAVERLGAWAALLAQRGVVLVPVSALVVP